MILDNDSASTPGNFGPKRGRALFENPHLLDSIWPWTNFRTSISVLKGSLGEMAPDQVSRLPCHPHRRYDVPTPNYSYFEPQESREYTSSLTFLSRSNQ
jgi:hypothetical protein